jgi:hypothetical protein
MSITGFTMSCTVKQLKYKAFLRNQEGFVVLSPCF